MKKKSIFDGASPYGTYEGEAGSPHSWRAGFADAWDYATAKKIIKNETPWDILGVAITATLAEITKVFRRLMLIHHPDKGGDAETCRKIIAAYTVLKERLG